MTPGAATMTVKLYDRFNRCYTIDGHVGFPLSYTLGANGIPEDAVLSVANGVITDAHDYCLSSSDEVSLIMIRAYHLPDILTVSGRWYGQVSDTVDTVPKLSDMEFGNYVQRQGIFLSDGEFFVDRHRYKNSQEFVQGIENRFIDSLKRMGLDPDEEILIALSGGRDSLAMTYLLSAARNAGVQQRFSAATVEIIALPKDLPVAQEACASIGVRHSIIEEAEIIRNFGLGCSIEEAIEGIRSRYGQASSIAACHVFMRSSMEAFARANSISTIALGLHNEDLFATLLRSSTRGFSIDGSIESRTWGMFQFIHPLYAITKKELTIYLRLVAPDHCDQGAPSRFDRGNQSRDINYLLSDSIQSLWPGASHFFFLGEAMKKSRVISEEFFAQCENCDTAFQASQDSNRNEPRCFTCDQLFNIGVLN